VLISQLLRVCHCNKKVFKMILNQFYWYSLDPRVKLNLKYSKIFMPLLLKLLD